MLRTLKSILLALNCATAALAQPDPFLHRRLYDRLHTLPAQEKFRALAPMPAGVVYIQ